MPVIEAASAADLETLPYWYNLAGVADPRGIADYAKGLLEAHKGGYLGSAIGNTRMQNLQVLVALGDERKWFYACTTVRVLKVDRRTIGILVMGAHVPLWNLLGGRAEGKAIGEEDFSQELVAFVATILSVAKIHILAVHSDYQRKGYGRRLVRDALDIARRSEMTMLFGQYESRRNLRAFYSSLGFDVLAPGAPLNIMMATRGANDYMGCLPTETFVVKMFL